MRTAVTLIKIDIDIDGEPLSDIRHGKIIITWLLQFRTKSMQSRTFRHAIYHANAITRIRSHADSRASRSDWERDKLNHLDIFHQSCCSSKGNVPSLISGSIYTDNRDWNLYTRVRKRYIYTYMFEDVCNVHGMMIILKIFPNWIRNK